MKVRFKKIHPNAVIPTKAHATDAGFDLVATSREEDMYGNISYGWVLLLKSRKDMQDLSSHAVVIARSSC